MREHLVSKDRVRHLRGVEQIHLQQTSLKVALFGLILLESIEQERSRRLDHVL